MSEIEKMYKNAGVNKINTHQSEIDNGDPRFTGISHSDSYIKYPPFTAAKQLELIKWLAVNKGISIQYYDDRNFAWGMSADFAGGHYFDKFEVTLADLINELWHSLTQEEKKQIKEILK